MSKKLTKRQQQILDIIREEMAVNKRPPTVREIGQKLGLSSSATVHTHLLALESKGYIKRDGSKSRALSLIGPAKTADDQAREEEERLLGNSVALPLVGQVAAGQPILAEQNIETTMLLPTDIVGDSSSFLLRVCGESMVEAGIYDGDYVVVKEADSARNGEIVVALVNDEATVKTFYRESDRIRLQPENHTMDPIYVDDVTILGHVTALFRRL